jgi:hypothetical protein
MTNNLMLANVEENALANIAAAAAVNTSRVPFVKFGRDGHFAVGINGDRVVSDEMWIAAVHEAEISKILFDGKGGFIDEIKRRVSEGRPIMDSELPNHGPNVGEWKDQMKLRFIHLPDMNQVEFGTTSQGGMRAVKTLMGEFAARMKTGKRGLPIVHMVPDSYKHSQYGTIHVPTFEIVGWTDEAANDETVEGEVVKAKKDSVLG